MWVKRPHGQLLKCAKAASLRAAFPEEADYTAEETEGKIIEADGMPVAGEAAGEVIEAEQATDPDVASTPDAGGAAELDRIIEESEANAILKRITQELAARGEYDRRCAA